MTTRSRALSFDLAAAQYAASRPSYPAALLDRIEDLAGFGLPGAQVADVGAGTGIATALLRERGADVLGVEPGAGMAGEFRRVLPRVPLVRGDGNALPLAGASCDLITYAQSWQWTDPVQAVPEAFRVLRAGGALAIWWNTTAFDVPWIREQHERIALHCGVAARSAVRPSDSDAIRLAGLTGLRVARCQVQWRRTVPLSMHLANIGSHSAFLVLEEAARRAFFAEERERLNSLFPGDEVEESYIVDLLMALRP